MKTRIIALLAIIAISLLSFGVAGCGSATPRKVCDQTNAAIGALGAYVDEAYMGLDRARKIAEAMPEKIRKEALLAVEVARSALYAVTMTASKISRQCAAFDLPTLFADFAEAWEGVKKLLDKFGGSEAMGLIDPYAYELGRKK